MELVRHHNIYLLEEMKSESLVLSATPSLAKTYDFWAGYQMIGPNKMLISFDTLVKFL